MLYLPQDPYFEKKQHDYHRIQNPLEDKPVLDRYGIPAAYKDIEGMLYEHKGYVRPGDSDYKREWPITELLPFIDAIVRTEMPPGLRGYCYPALRQVFIRHGDPDSDKVHHHENKHVQIHGQDPYHSEWEIRRLDSLRYGHENNN